MTAPHHWQDARLKKALENAPDFQATPSSATQNEILKAAAAAVAESKSTLSPWWKSILNQFVEKANFSRNAGFATAVVIICVGVIWTVGDPMKSLDPLSSQEVPTSTADRAPVTIAPPAMSEPSVVVEVELASIVTALSPSVQDVTSSAVSPVSQTQAVTPNAPSAQLPLQAEPIVTTAAGVAATENSIVLQSQAQAGQDRTSSSSRVERERAAEEMSRIQALPHPSVEVAEMARAQARSSPSMAIQDNIVANSPSDVDITHFARDERVNNSERDYRAEITVVPDLVAAPVFDATLASGSLSQSYTAPAPMLQSESETIAESSTLRQLERERHSEKPQQNMERIASNTNYHENLPLPQILSGDVSTPAPVPAREQTIPATVQNEQTEVDAQRNEMAISEEANRASTMFDAQPPAQSTSVQTERTDYKTLIHMIYAWDELYLTSPYGTTIVYRQSAKDLQTWLGTIPSHSEKTLPRMNSNQSVWLLTFYQKSAFLGTIAIQEQKWVFSTAHPCQLDCKLPENPSLGGILSESDAKAIEQSMSNLIP